MSLICSVKSGAQKIHPLTQAMLNGYEELLKQNPNDYQTLYDRASQYYNLSEYDKALSDILRALNCTPAKEKTLIAAEASLAANVYTQLKDYPNALTMINRALEIEPGSYSYIYQRGNIYLYLKNAEEAKRNFNSLLRLKSRSQEALFGLARCAILEGKNSEARTYLEEAEKTDQNNYITHCRIGDLYQEMGENQNAAASYLSAFSLNSRDERSLSSLFDLGRKDYDSVTYAIDYAMSLTQNQVPLLFIMGNIAKETGHYDDAYAAYTALVNTDDGKLPEVQATMAEICRQRNSLDEAFGYAQRAYNASPNTSYQLVKASLDYDLMDYEAAAQLCDDILAKDPENLEALIIRALTAVAQNDLTKASDSLSVAIAVNPLDARPLLLRGYLADKYKISTLPGKSDFIRVSQLSPANDLETIYKAIGQTYAGKTLDANDTLAPVLKKASDNADAAYLMALYYAATNNIDKGKNALDSARKLGFSNSYLLNAYAAPMLSVAVLR